jgi:hypothetical protein
MIDFPITDLLDDAASMAWLEQHLHPNGLHCPHCGVNFRDKWHQIFSVIWHSP